MFEKVLPHLLVFVVCSRWEHLFVGRRRRRLDQSTASAGPPAPPPGRPPPAVAAAAPDPAPGRSALEHPDPAQNPHHQRHQEHQHGAEREDDEERGVLQKQKTEGNGKGSSAFAR